MRNSGRNLKKGRIFDTDKLDVVADRGYFKSTEILACDQAGITVTLPKPSTSTAKAEGRFGKQDFRYVADEDVYLTVRPPKGWSNMILQFNGR